MIRYDGMLKVSGKNERCWKHFNHRMQCKRLQIQQRFMNTANIRNFTKSADLYFPRIKAQTHTQIYIDRSKTTTKAHFHVCFVLLCIFFASGLSFLKYIEFSIHCIISINFTSDVWTVWNKSPSFISNVPNVLRGAHQHCFWMLHSCFQAIILCCWRE